MQFCAKPIQIWKEVLTPCGWIKRLRTSIIVVDTSDMISPDDMSLVQVTMMENRTVVPLVVRCWSHQLEDQLIDRFKLLRKVVNG